MHKNQETFFSRKLSEQAHTHIHTDKCHTFVQTTLIAQIRLKSKSSRLSSLIAISVLWRNLFKIQNTFLIETNELSISRRTNVSESKIYRHINRPPRKFVFNAKFHVFRLFFVEFFVFAHFSPNLLLLLVSQINFVVIFNKKSIQFQSTALNTYPHWLFIIQNELSYVFFINMFLSKTRILVLTLVSFDLVVSM